MARTFTLEVVTPEEEMYSEEIYSLRAPAHEGNLGILPGHAPMLASLNPGMLQIRKEPEGTIQLIAISGGFLEVGSERTVILADAAERPSEIDVDRARDAYIRAFKRLYGDKMKQQELERERAEEALQRARVRLKTARKAGREAEVPDMVK